MHLIPRLTVDLRASPNMDPIATQSVSSEQLHRFALFPISIRNSMLIVNYWMIASLSAELPWNKQAATAK